MADIVRLALEGNFFFSWDPAKAEINLRKHGISFEDAAHAFLDSRSLLSVDPHPDGDRMRLIGFSETVSAILFVVHVERTLVGKDDDSVVLRIVSARRADRKERELYDEG